MKGMALMYKPYILAAIIFSLAACSHADKQQTCCADQGGIKSCTYETATLKRWGEENGLLVCGNEEVSSCGCRIWARKNNEDDD
jgi:hypothetical protein